MTPLKAIRAKCLDCCCGLVGEVRLCPCEDCTLWPFRFGHNPNRAGIANSGLFAAKNNGSTGDFTRENISEGSYTPEDTPTEKEA